MAWRKSRKEPPILIELVPSRWDDEPAQRARSMLSALSGAPSFSLEFASSGSGLRFYLRGASETAIAAALGQLRAAYPQTDFRRIPIASRCDLDPAQQLSGELSLAFTLRLEREVALPLATDQRRGDPLLGVLAAASSAADGERIVSQLILGPAPANWGDGLRSRAAVLERGSRREAAANPAAEILPLLALFGLGAVGLRGYAWYQQGEFLPLLGLGAAGLVGLPMALTIGSRILAGREPLDPGLLEDKLAYPAFAANLRVLVFGPSRSSVERLRSLATGVAEAYRAFDHPAGNSLRQSEWRGDPSELGMSRVRVRRVVLNAGEIAALWHLPGDASGLPISGQASGRRFVPVEDQPARGCRVGVSLHQGRQAPAYMPGELLHRNQLVVAKTRRGKSTLLIHMASYLMERIASGRGQVLVVVDPHQDLAEAVLGAVPDTLEHRVTYLNLGDLQRPVGLNLLDVGLFPSRDRTAENVVTMLHRLWPDNWGPRMEGALRASLLSLHESNQARRREEQHTLLDVVPMLSSADFREEVLKQVPDRALWAWWRDNYDRLGRAMQQQTANPVTTKVGRFLVTEASRLVVGQACSTFDPRSLLQGGGVLVVNSAVGLLGEGAAALVGATVLNLLGLVVEEQVALPPAQRSRLIALVDESSTLGAADYPRMLSELGKYGASFVLVTQSLAKLDAIDRALRPTVFSNIDGLTVFQVSAEDARYLAPELGGDLEVGDLTTLDDFECYARWPARGRRLPTFSLRLDRPAAIERERVAAIAKRSADHFGRPREDVAKEIEERLVARGVKVRPSQAAQTEKAEGEKEEGAMEEVQPTGKQNPKPRGRGQRKAEGKR